MSPPTQRSGAPPPRERPTPESSSRRQATEPRETDGTAGRRPGVVMLPVRSLTLALDELDERGLCACWVAGRRCPRRRWSR